MVAHGFGGTVWFSKMAELIELIRQYQEAPTLVERIRASDEIIDAVATPLRLYITRRMGKDWLDDVCQETLKGVFAGLHKFRGDSNGQAWGWCYAIASNQLAEHFRKWGRDRLDLVVSDEVWQAIRAASSTMSISTAEMELLEHAMDLLKAAKPPCYDYLWNRYMLGWDNQMIAEAFDLNYGSVHVIIRRCLETARSLATTTA